MLTSDKLYHIVKKIDKDTIDGSKPFEVWRLWVHNESETWKRFAEWYKTFYQDVSNIDENVLLDIFFKQRDDLKSFLDDWVADEERNSFIAFMERKYNFCIAEYHLSK